MPAEQLDTNTLRAKEARLGRRIGKFGAGLALLLAIALAILTALGLWQGKQQAWILLAPALWLLMLAVWWKWQLSVIPATGGLLNQRLSKDVLERLPKKSAGLTPADLWKRLSRHWQLIFITNHLLISPKDIQNLLSGEPKDLMFVWDKAAQMADQDGLKAIEPAHVTAGLMLSSKEVNNLLIQVRLTEKDVIEVVSWLNRILRARHRHRQSYGGIGRDWSNGWTPMLNQFAVNISATIEHLGGQASSLVNSSGVNQMKQAFSQGSGAIALVGPEGIGKTSHVWALAQNLLAEAKDRGLKHNQIYSISPSPIISVARRQGDLEHILNMLMNEASHAGNVVLFFDDFDMFFKPGVGSFDATKVLQPAVQNRSVRFIFAMNQEDFQRLKATSPALGGLLTPVVLQEPDQPAVMDSLEDAATRFEMKHKVNITYQALTEAYNLSQRYDPDTAYPGRAIKLLEQSLSHQNNKLVTPESIQATIEQTTGVKTGSAAPAEAEQLLNLEDQIHQRMVNQNHAVSVVASALRRARAGVGDPKRPIGSFMFLGPTGVGKTELAKSIAATYFGNETSMIRLDMSEYQQESDVSRLLSSGQNESTSLAMQVRQRPFSVVLLDEVEKANPNILNLLLQMLDEGQLTDDKGRKVSFKDSIVICTSNAGADTIRQKIEQGEKLEDFAAEFSDQLINSGQFKPELINRFDEIVLFRQLMPNELKQVVQLQMKSVNQSLASQNITVELTDAAAEQLVAQGNDPRLGARPMRRAVQKHVQDVVAEKILKGQAKPGDKITLDTNDLKL